MKRLRTVSLDTAPASPAPFITATYIGPVQVLRYALAVRGVGQSYLALDVRGDEVAASILPVPDCEVGDESL